MFDLAVRMNKPAVVIISIVWLLCVAAIITPQQTPAASVFQGIAIFLVVAHVIEMLVYRRFLSAPIEYLKVFFFGVLYIKPKAKALALQRKQTVA
jgi:uncharacterized protein YhhL (DUF1145 family)